MTLPSSLTGISTPNFDSLSPELKMHIAGFLPPPALSSLSKTSKLNHRLFRNNVYWRPYAEALQKRGYQKPDESHSDSSYDKVKQIVTDYRSELSRQEERLKGMLERFSEGVEAPRDWTLLLSQTLPPLLDFPNAKVRRLARQVLSKYCSDIYVDKGYKKFWFPQAVLGRGGVGELFDLVSGTAQLSQILSLKEQPNCLYGYFLDILHPILTGKCTVEELASKFGENYVKHLDAAEYFLRYGIFEKERDLDDILTRSANSLSDNSYSYVKPCPVFQRWDLSIQERPATSFFCNVHPTYHPLKKKISRQALPQG